MFEIYKALTIFPSQRWRWRVTAVNGEPLSASAEGFRHRADCEKNAILTRDALIAHLGWPKK